jgi:putative tryptophan/tyrosine transport system substrate-binding protein
MLSTGSLATTIDRVSAALKQHDVLPESGSSDELMRSFNFAWDTFSIGDFTVWIIRTRIKRAFCFILTLLLLALCASAAAQQPQKVARIGFLTAGSAATIAARIDALRQGMRDLGYVEDKNIVVEWRFGEGKPDRIPALVAELVGLKVEVIVSAGSAVTQPARDATKTIPIVMTQDTDPVGNGFVASLARPGGNITGLSSYSAELNGKRVELLKEIVPKLSHLAVVGQSSYPGNAESLKETELAGDALRVHVRYLDVLGPKDIETAFAQASTEHANGVLTLQSAILNSSRKQTVDSAIKRRLPTIYYAPEFLDGGGLISYAPSINDLYRRAAMYVDKILKGAKPSELPVEQPTKFELMINLKTAKQIGLTVPPAVLARADKVIR